MAVLSELKGTFRLHQFRLLLNSLSSTKESVKAKVKGITIMSNNRDFKKEYDIFQAKIPPIKQRLWMPYAEKT